MSRLFTVIFLCSICILSAIQAESVSCTYQAGDGSFYDLTQLITAEDLVTSTVGSMDLFYFAICRDTHTCEGAACSMSGEESRLLGDIQAMEWSERYTHHGQGISLVYGNGQSSCDTDGQTSSFIVTVLCDESGQSDSLLLGFKSECDKNHVSLKSRFACPTQKVVAEDLPSSESSAGPEDSSTQAEGFNSGILLPFIVLVCILGPLAVLSCCMISLKWASKHGVFDENSKTSDAYDPLIIAEKATYPL